ncbi:MAG: hypothetical protein AAFR13_01665 [Pseudomonadota bacterium]
MFPYYVRRQDKKHRTMDGTPVHPLEDPLNYPEQQDFAAMAERWTRAKKHLSRLFNT